MLKRVLRKTVHSLNAWLEDFDDVRADPTSDLGRLFAFPRLNNLVYRIADELGSRQRPNYTWGLVYAAHQAECLGVPTISVIEFGVAGGTGLLAMESAAEIVAAEFSVQVDVYGFDTGRGLPPPTDIRDLPHLFRPGDFDMDVEALRSRLESAQLVLGLVDETLPRFIDAGPAPVAFVSFDLDYYSSTIHALQLFDADPVHLMPRVYCYFDDIMGFSFADHNGERLAVAEFNDRHRRRKISPIHGLRHYVGKRWMNDEWVEKTYMAHILDHGIYPKYDGQIVDPSIGLRTEHPPARRTQRPQ